MNCCSGCFLDNELKGFVNSNSNSEGNCDFCKLKDVAIIDAKELQDLFLPLFEIYTLNDNGLNAVEAFQKDWKVFNIKNTKVIRKLLSSIVSGLDEKYETFLGETIDIKIQSETQELIDNWNSFKEEIKRENRFIIKTPIEFDSIEETLPIREYLKGKIFYRSRISSDIDGHSKDVMGKPPHESAKSGRANPDGIPYLYLAQSIETTLYEARATYLDYLTIGEFKLKENIKVITLRTSFQVSPFLEDFSIEEYLKNKGFIDILENELAKPLRRYDNELDYLPTQYLCEYIKHLGYDGVEYGSSLNEGGINLVIFNDHLLECVNTIVHEISNIDIQYGSV